MDRQRRRTFSETLRADYRGNDHFSAYQVMGLLAILFAPAISYILPMEPNLNTELASPPPGNPSSCSLCKRYG